jgi:hypothetical protein
MRWIRWPLIAGGVFNAVMGCVFFSTRLLELFFQAAIHAEQTLFHQVALLPFPDHPVHLLLIHGFGAAAIILGVTLIVSANDPVRYLPFIFFDALGRLLFGSLMLIYVFRFALPKVILLFGSFELLLALIYLGISWKLAEP